MSTAQPNRALQGIACAIIGMALITVQDGLMKSLIGPYPLWILLALRGIAGLIILVPLIAWLGAPHRLITPLWRLHLARAFLISTGFAMFYAAFPFMGLAEVSTIFFACPLMIAALAAFWLKEPIGPHRLGALVVGFIGVIVALNPTAEAFRPVALLPLFCAVFYAVAQILARRIGDRETGMTTGLYTTVLMSVVILPVGALVSQILPETPDVHHLRWEWLMPERSLWVQMVALAVVGVPGFMFLSLSYQLANASLIAPFDYSYLPMASLMAFIIWAETPPVNTLIGMAMIIAGGCYLGLRELRASRMPPPPPPGAQMTM